MIVRTKSAVLAILLASVAASPAIGADPAGGQKTNKNDPNEVVCEKIMAAGSRVNIKKVCATRAEWAERRMRARQDIDKSQTQVGLKGQ